MKNNLEKIIGIYKEQGKTLGSHAVAFGVSTAGAALASNIASNISGNSNAITSLAGTVSAMGVYWPTFIGGLIIRDRKDFKNENGINWGKVKERAEEYATWIGVGELAYGLARTGIQAYAQHEGYDPAVSSVMADSISAGLYTLGLPFIQMGIDYARKKKIW